jgi:hypothetical protein
VPYYLRLLQEQEQDEYMRQDQILHTYSDEKVKTGEVTLETPLFINDENQSPQKHYVSKVDAYINKKPGNVSQIERKYYPFSNISNIRETE